MWRKAYHKSAFTLLELILVVVLVSISAGIVAPIYYSAKSNSDLNTALYTIVSSVRRAQLLSMAVYYDDSWGLKLSDGQLIIFKGTDFLNRDLDFDEEIKLSSLINISGLDEIVFNKLNGRPNISGDIFLVLNNRQLSININQLGVVDY